MKAIQLSLPGFRSSDQENLPTIERRRVEREIRGMPWVADPSWVRCPNCEGVHPVEAIIWWGEPVCTKCFTIESVQPALKVPDPRPLPHLDYRRGAALPNPGLRIRDVVKDFGLFVLNWVWYNRLVTLLILVLLLTLTGGTHA